MKRKFVAIMMAFGIMSSLFGANYASAETKSETKTFSGNVVKSTLKCTWSARGNILEGNVGSPSGSKTVLCKIYLAGVY